MGSGIFASLVALILDCKGGYHVFTFVGVIGFIGYEILRGRLVSDD